MQLKYINTLAAIACQPLDVLMAGADKIRISVFIQHNVYCIETILMYNKCNDSLAQKRPMAPAQILFMLMMFSDLLAS